MKVRIMNVEDQLIHNEKFFQNCIDLMKPKAKDYATDGVVFVELLRQAYEVKVSGQTVLWILLRKHITAIREFLINEKVESESIDSRLMDVANQIALIHLLINNYRNVCVDIVDYVLSNEECAQPSVEGSCIMQKREDRCDRCEFLKWLTDQHGNLDSLETSSQSTPKQLDFSPGLSET